MRMKRVIVSPRMLCLLFQQGEMHVRCLHGLPKDAKFCYSYVSDNYNINFVFASDEWPQLKDNELIPQFELIFEKI